MIMQMISKVNIRTASGINQIFFTGKISNKITNTAYSWIQGRVERHSHVWYIYSASDFSTQAIRSLIETERDLNQDVIKDWTTFVRQKVKLIRKEWGFWCASNWLKWYNRRFGNRFCSYWELFQSESHSSSNNNIATSV